MSKEELILVHADINSGFVSGVNSKLNNLEEMFNDFWSKYDKVNFEMQQCKKFN